MRWGSFLRVILSAFEVLFLAVGYIDLEALPSPVLGSKVDVSMC